MKKHFHAVVQIVTSVPPIIIGTVRSITLVPQAVLSIQLLPCWSFFLHTIVQLMRAYISLHVCEINKLRLITDFPLMPTIPRNVAYWQEMLNGVLCEIIVPRKDSTHDIIQTLEKGALGISLYLHGGGFALCNPATHRSITHYLSEQSNCVVVVPDYRRLPEHTLSDALSDCQSVFDYLREFNVKISLVGDSAGGALCVMLAEQLRRGIAAVALISPWCDFTDNFDDTDEKIGLHDYLSPYALQVIGRIVVEGMGGVKRTPLQIVSEGRYPEEIPTLVQVGGAETLYKQIMRFTKFVKICEIRQYGNMIHVPQFFALMHEEAHRAAHDLCEFNRKQLVCNIMDDKLVL